MHTGPVQTNKGILMLHFDNTRTLCLFFESLSRPALSESIQDGEIVGDSRPRTNTASNRTAMIREVKSTTKSGELYRDPKSQTIYSYQNDQTHPTWYTKQKSHDGNKGRERSIFDTVYYYYYVRPV